MSRRQLFTTLLLIAGLFLVCDPAFAQGGDEPTIKSVSWWTMYNYGGIVGYLLTILSFISLGLAIEHFMSLRQDQMVPPGLVENVEGLFEDEEYEEVMNMCEDQPTMLTNVLAAGLPKIGTGWNNISEAMGEVANFEATKLNQKVSYIGLIASIAPLMGLFGTVTGMIATFNTIANSKAAPKPKELASGIQQALVTTCMGLMVAIPATVLFFFFRNRVVRTILEVNAIIEELMDRFREE
jgi:biopolymer transport protein ExbB